MNHIEAMKLALEALEVATTPLAKDRQEVLRAQAAIREALAEQPAQPKCNPHPKAPHGFDRNASHSADRYVCDCESWEPYDAGYQAGFEKGLMSWEDEQPAQQQEPVAWMPIEQMYPQAKAIDILMGDGSILCAVLPQFDGDLWWEGSGTGEKFIDPKYADVTHWRIHNERTSPQPAQHSASVLEQNTSNSLETTNQEAQDEPVAHSIVAGALFDFMGWLTSRRERLALSSTDDAAPAADAIKDFAHMRSLSINDAKVQEWQKHLAAPPPRKSLTDEQPSQVDPCIDGSCSCCWTHLDEQPASKPWVSLTDEEIDEGQRQSWVEKQAFESAVWWAEAKLKEKNT